jgi:glycosyltransferase involved in cell wall biosynthesis
MSTCWEPPQFETCEFFPKRTRYCVCIPVWNEGDRLRAQLERMRSRAGLADIIICDGGSTDGATEPDFLARAGVRALLSTGEPGLGTATRMGVAYALEQGYDGVVTVDGNGKDGVEALPDFLAGLEAGCDLVQGSRFMRGGTHGHTPIDRQLAIRLFLAPLLGIASGRFYTDPTNGFRALSRRFLTDPRVQPVRRIFVRFNLQLYFVHRAAQLRFKVAEIPVSRVYPGGGLVPTKIHGLGPRLVLLRELFEVVLGRCNP